jgi:hypothetical protein
MEVNDDIVEQLIDIGVSMSIMFTHVMWELGLMYLVIGNETYKKNIRSSYLRDGKVGETTSEGWWNKM